MSEQINKVLASTAQAFSTAQQKQARDNISAQAKISYSYSGSTITAIDGSAVGNPASLTGVEHDYNLSGSGTSAVPLGLADPIKMSAQHTAGDPVSSMSLGNTGLKFEVPSAHTSQVDYNQVKVNFEWPSALDVEHSLGWYAHGEIDGGFLSLSAHDCSYISHNVITGSTNNNPYLGIYGGYGSGSLQTSIVAAAGDQYRNDPYIAFGFSGSSEVVDQSSIRRWNSYSAGLFTGASADNCISGDGTSGSPLGMSATARWTAGGNWYPMTEISAGHLKISAQAFAGAQVYQNESSLCNWTPTGITVRHSASAVGGGNIDNLYGEIINLNYNAGEYYLRHISSDASGLRAKQNGNPNNVSIFGFGSAAFSDDDGSTWEVVDPASIRRWNGYSATTVSAGNGITGDGSTGSPLGLSGKIKLETSYSSLSLQPNYILVNNHVGSSQIGNAYVTLTTPLFGGATAHLNDSALRFTDSANHTAQVDISSIDKWNASLWNESGNSLSTGWGGNQVSAASQYNDGPGNWAARTVKISGLPDQTLYGFQSRPAGTATYGINQAGAFVAVPQQHYFTYLYHKTGEGSEDLGTSIYPTGLTADARIDFVNLCSGMSANIQHDTFHGATAIIDPGQSATMWYIATAGIWTDGGNPVPV